jgi:drug/metabolite transporter (DMT)-like permease
MSGPLTNKSQAPTVPRVLLAELSLLSVAVIWGVNIPVMKVALELRISPYALNAIRLVISAIVLQGFAWHEYRRGIRPASNLSWRRVVIYALVVSVAYQLLFLLAVSKTTSANVALIMATVPMWTALGARFFLKEILPPLAWIGLIIAFAGTMIVTVQRASSNEPRARAPAALNAVPVAATPESAQSVTLPDPNLRIIGNMMALVAALAWAGGTVFSRPLLRTISPTQLAACSATIGLPFHIMIAAPTLGASLPLLSQVPLQLCILYSGILSTGLALAMWSYGVKHAGAAQAAMFQNLSPIIAILAAWLWRGETVSIAQTIGGAMILGGLIIMRQSRRVPAPA